MKNKYFTLHNFKKRLTQLNTMKKLFSLLILLLSLQATAANEHVSTNGQAEVEVTASYGITEEVLLKALDYYENICSLEDINNIRRNLHMPTISSCDELKQQK